MAVSYARARLDPSCAAVADRLRKQAKTRAVKMLRDALADPAAAPHPLALTGTHGPNALAPTVTPLLLRHASLLALSSTFSPSPILDPATPRRFVVFPAKNARHGPGPAPGPGPAHSDPRRVAPRSEETRKALAARHSAASSTLPEAAGGGGAGDEAEGGAYFPVSLLVTAIGDGRLAGDVTGKVRERLEQVRRKIPKEQLTSVELRGATLDIKLRVFVTNRC